MRLFVFLDFEIWTLIILYTFAAIKISVPIKLKMSSLPYKRSYIIKKCIENYQILTLAIIDIVLKEI